MTAERGLLIFLSLLCFANQFTPFVTSLKSKQSLSCHLSSSNLVPVELNPLTRYISHDEMMDLLIMLENKFPHLCTLYVIGRSVEGRELVVARITDLDTDKDGLKPMVKYIGNMHGDEAVSRQMMLRLIIELLTGFQNNDPQIRRILTETEVHILPTMNPDGFSRSIEGLCFTFESNGCNGRSNANGIDLNRDFPTDPKIGNHQPETLAVMNWTLKNPFVLSANFHGGALLVSYLYDHSPDGSTTYSSSPDDKLCRYLASVYTSNHKIMKSGYKCNPGDPSCMTNGADWYPFQGSLQDFTYLYSNCIDLTVELSCCKYPSRDKLKYFWLDNRRPLLKLIEAVHMGVKGFITDGETGESLAGVHIFLQDNAKVTKSDNKGRYWRLLMLGQSYNLTFKARGYSVKTFKSVIVDQQGSGADAVVRLDVMLWKEK